MTRFGLFTLGTFDAIVNHKTLNQLNSIEEISISSSDIKEALR